MLAGIPIAVIWGYPKFYVVILLMLPLVFDGFIQKLTSYESTNIRRLFTGILFGISFIFIIIYFHITCFKGAAEVLKLFSDDPGKIEQALDKFI